MSDSTCLTLKNAFPRKIGSATCFFKDETGMPVSVAAPALGVVQYPAAAANGRWIDIVGTASDFPAAPDPTGRAPSSPRSLLDKPESWKNLRDLLLPPATPGSWKKLRFRVQPEEQTHWCWSAVAASVVTYYTQAWYTQYTQCSLADWAFGEQSCCKSGGSPLCNRPFSPGGALSYMNCLNGPELGRPLDLGEVCAQIAASRPIGIRIVWQEGGTAVGHVVSIHGYDARDPTPDSATIDVSDPWCGSSVVNFKRFPADYYGGGSWTHTYLTKAPD